MDRFVDTRLALHSVAEHLLAADLHRRTGKIGLRRSPGGFGQPETVVDGSRHRLRVDGTSLLVLAGDTEREVALDTLGRIGETIGVVPGAPTELFHPTTELRADHRLAVDRDAAGIIARCFAFGENVLEELRRRNRRAAPTILQIWPEHFDLACSFGEVNYGISPGDEQHRAPYLYVGPWAPVAGDGWNEPWGASLAWTEDLAEAEALAFFERLAPTPN